MRNQKDTAHEVETDLANNVSYDELEKLNGLVVRALIEKIERGEAKATDISNAVKVLISNKVQPERPNQFGYGSPVTIRDEDWPFPVGETD